MALKELFVFWGTMCSVTMLAFLLLERRKVWILVLFYEKVKVESEKVGLKLNIQKTKIMASGPIT